MKVRLTNDWKYMENMVLYGAGSIINMCAELFDKVDAKICFVIDGDINKQCTEWNGIPIISFEEAKMQLQNKKIIITTGHTAYNEISKTLNEYGLEEFKDYCEIGQFVCDWFWMAKRSNYLYHVDMMIVEKCTFSCKNCNMFIPYYKSGKEYSFEDLKQNVDLFFKRVEYVVWFGLIGGETLLYSELSKILSYINQKYGNRIGKITITTNGSIVPTDELIKTLKQCDVSVEVSDYRNAVSYEKKFNQVIEVLEANKVHYKILKTLIWTDFGFPNNPVQRDEKQLKEHLSSCHPEWNGLSDGKFYYCNVSCSASKSGLFKLNQKDYIVLKDINENDKDECHKIVELSRGTSSFCKICGGCGSDNTNYVPVGEQLQ